MQQGLGACLLSMWGEVRYSPTMQWSQHGQARRILGDLTPILVLPALGLCPNSILSFTGEGPPHL